MIEESLTTRYQYRIQNRSFLRFLFGAIARYINYSKYQYNIYIARKNGAIIGKNTVISRTLAKKANENLIIGNSCSLQTDNLDLRAPITIGNNVIIGENVEILTCSHNIDSKEWNFKSYGVKIEDYSWLATSCFILPSCRYIGKGAVVGAKAVVYENVNEMSVVSGNPAKHIKFRKNIHSDLIVESLLGGDYEMYIKTWKGRR